METEKEINDAIEHVYNLIIQLEPRLQNTVIVGVIREIERSREANRKSHINSVEESRLISGELATSLSESFIKNQNA